MAHDKSQRTHCGLALGILLLILAVAGGGILWPWAAKLREYDDKAQELAGNLERYQQVNARKSRLEAELQEVRRQLGQNNYYLDATTPALAAAELQKLVKDVVEGRGGKLVSTQNVDAVAGEIPARIAVRVRMNGDVDAMTKILHELEGGRPLLFVENLSIRSLRQVRGRGRERVTDFTLDINFDLVGYLLGAEG
jgi:general secretion pathway protein M